MPYRIPGIDVHKKMLAIVLADVEVDGDLRFERQKTGTTPLDLRRLADWLVEREVEEVVMESPRNTGGRCGKRSSNIGVPAAVRGTARPGWQAHSILSKRNRIADPADARRTSPMRSGW
jgi:hypothetical protein